ncbi:MAG TPA: leucyl aminopeptidase [Terrimesophilobacter sp.]|nr:leucyl aminopeptidase [Terrimesophilobacter sp.]
MSLASLSTSSDSPATLVAGALVLGVRSSDSGPTLLHDDPAFAELAGSLAGLGVTGSEDELRRTVVVGVAATTVALVGLGSAEPTANALRRAAGAATRQLSGTGSLAFALPTLSHADVLAVLEGAAIASYSFSAYRSKAPEAHSLPPTEITVVTDVTVSADALASAQAVAEAVHTVRDLVNTPPSDLYPQTFADRAIALAEGLGVAVTVLAEAELTEGGYGGILGVGQGSSRGPRLVKIEYSPPKPSGHVALVGKGITFDSGGLSLKPPASMVGMKYDMTGAATVLAVTLAAAKLGVGTRITAWLCLAENLPSGSAIRPNDVLRIRGGKTVEVLNTDAEGRLVLADGLVAAGEENPDVIIDVATLTGAARVALGDRYVGVMGNGSAAADVVTVADEVGELMWRMPLGPELRSMLNSDVADIANAKIGSSTGGMLLAGAFLKEFIGNDADGKPFPWVHLDIASTANNEGAGYGYTAKGPTGVAVRTLLAYTERFSRA